VHALSYALAITMTSWGSGQTEVQERVLQVEDGLELRYTISIPLELDTDTPAPLVLALHYGWQGDLPQYYGRGFLEPMVEPAFAGLGAIIVAPDCPDTDWHQPRSEKALLVLLDEIRSEFSVSPDRIVITGYSLGGMGTWFLAVEHPEIFSAAIPMASPPMLDRPDGSLRTSLNRFFEGGAVPAHEAIGGMPFYAIHGRLDEVIPLAPVQEAIEDLKAGGASIEFVIVEGASHYDMGWYVDPLKRAVEWLKQIWSTP
jgi:predicted peptidase